MNSHAVVFPARFLETEPALARFSLWTSDEFGNRLEAPARAGKG